MGAIAGVFGSADNPETVTENLLLALKHRGTKMSVAGMNGWAVGCLSNDGLKSHFVESAKSVLAVNGSFFGHKNDVKFAYRHLAKGLVRSAATALMCKPGAFAVLGMLRNWMFAFRDPNGLKPLYYAGSSKLLAFASERKALWRIGLEDINRVLPGYLCSITGRRATQAPLLQTKRPREKTMTLEQARNQLAQLLKRSIRRVAKGTEKVAVAFSGGLDSAMTATLAKSVGKVELVSVGLSGSPELSTVEKYARQIDLPVEIEAFEPDSLEEYVRRVVWLIEEPSLMKVSVAVPLHWAAKVAARKGFPVMLCGQGSDELYGGYYKYAKTLDTKGRRALVNELYQSVVDASQVNYERDEQATAPFDVELRSPFADLDVVQYSLSIPSEYKVRGRNDLTRKWILRSVAEVLGLPKDIAWRRKKAIQHGTGVEKGIRKLAKSRSMTVESYLAGIHAEVKSSESMP